MKVGVKSNAFILSKAGHMTIDVEFVTLKLIGLDLLNLNLPTNKYIDLCNKSEVSF